MMKRIQVPSLLTVSIFFLMASPHEALAQTSGFVSHSDTYAVSISMETEKVTTSQSPSVAFAIKNISSKPTGSTDCASDPRVWVQGANGEPPTTYRERASTLRLRPGEPELACTLNMSWSLAPGESRILHVLLDYLYDLHQPGKYSVYLEFPAPEGWLRTNTVTFYVVPEVRSGEKQNP
jgi:hypothetical protein